MAWFVAHLRASDEPFRRPVVRALKSGRSRRRGTDRNLDIMSCMCGHPFRQDVIICLTTLISLSIAYKSHVDQTEPGGSEDQDERQHESVRRGGGDGPLLVVVSKKDFSGCFHKVVFYLDPHHRRPQFPVAHSSIFIPTGCRTGFRLLISSYWNINIFCCSGSKRDANFQGILGVSLKFKSRIAEFVLKLFPRPFIFHFTYGDRIITETFFFFFFLFLFLLLLALTTEWHFTGIFNNSSTSYFKKYFIYIYILV